MHLPSTCEGSEVKQMSLRYSANDVVSQSSIERFLQMLAIAFQQPSNLYLTGDAVLAHQGLRSSISTTLSLVVEATDEEGMIAAIKRSAERAHLATAFTSPED